MNDVDFKNSLNTLSLNQQRRLGALFVQNVMSLSDSDAVKKIVEILINTDALSNDELVAALKTAKTAALVTHTRCGSDCDWGDQARYFIARAAQALVTTSQIASPAWDAAVNARMVQTCYAIASEDESMHEESQRQYQILEAFLNDV